MADACLMSSISVLEKSSPMTDRFKQASAWHYLMKEIYWYASGSPDIPCDILGDVSGGVHETPHTQQYLFVRRIEATSNESSTYASQVVPPAKSRNDKVDYLSVRITGIAVSSSCGKGHSIEHHLVCEANKAVSSSITEPLQTTGDRQNSRQ